MGCEVGVSEARARRQEAATFEELIGGDTDRVTLPGRGFASAGPPDSPGEPIDAELRRMVSLSDRLRGLEIAAEPSPDFRAALRTKLLAEPPAAEVARPPRRTVRPALSLGVRGRLAAGWSLLRFPQLTARTVAGMAMLSMIVAMAGVLVIASRGALPGDSLYAVKRASERAELALTIGGESRGMTLLSFAQTRLTEVDQLVHQQQPLSMGVGDHAGSDDVDSATADLVGDALTDMDSDTRRGAKLLTNRAVETASEEPLTLLSTWTATHRAQLAGMMGYLPGGLAERAQESSVLLDWVDYRVLTLQYSFAHSCQLDLANADELGPMPCSPEGTTTALGQAPNSPTPDLSTLPPAPPGASDPGTSAAPQTPADQPPAGTNPSTAPGTSAAPQPPVGQQPANPTTQPGGGGILTPGGDDTQPGGEVPPGGIGDTGTNPPVPPNSPEPAPPPSSAPPPSCLLSGPLGQLLNICLG